MRTISNSLLILAAAGALASVGRAQGPVPGDCPMHLKTIEPRLRDSGYEVGWQAEASTAPYLRATHVETAGWIDIEYRCGAGGLDVSVVNHGLPDIPFHVLLAAGPGARHSQAMPEWLRKRYEAVRR